MKSKAKKVTVYLDGIDWQYEVGEAIDGNKVYPDVNSLKKYNRCWDGCGIVECELVFKKWVVEHNFKRMSKDSTSYSAEELETNRNILRLESAKKHLEYLEELVCKQKQKVINLKVDLKGKK
jgi:hypothetical protein